MIEVHVSYRDRSAGPARYGTGGLYDGNANRQAGQMIRGQFRRRALSDIGRELADSDPRLGELFLSFNERTSGGKIPCTEKIRARPLALLARIGRRMRPVPADFDHMATWWT